MEDAQILDKEIGKDYFEWSSPTAWILAVSFIISFAALIVYLVDLDFSDDFLFLLIKILQYSSFMIIICSLYKLLLNIYRFFRHSMKIRPLKIVMYVILLIYSVIIVLLVSFINIIARGNG